MKKINLKWEKNPSAPENFYEEPGLYEDFSSEVVESEKIEEVKEELNIEEIINEKEETPKIEEVSSDPYSNILKDLK